MKKILGLAAMALFVASVAVAEVSTTTAASTTTPSTTTTTTDYKAVATVACQKKGLAGSLLDECVKNELAKNTASSHTAPTTNAKP